MDVVPFFKPSVSVLIKSCSSLKRLSTTLRNLPSLAQIKVMAQVTERVAKGVAFLPFHFGGHMEGKDLRSKYPEGADPYVLGEAANTAMTYGYDSVTLMQETKCSLCTIERV